MKILILGDCHGRLDLVLQICNMARYVYEIDAAIQVGDFGFFPKVINAYLRDPTWRLPIPLHVIDGNHEDHDWLSKARMSGEVDTWREANLHVHARGTVAQIGGASIGFIGGALHADRRQKWCGQWKPSNDGTRFPGRRPVPKDPAWANWVTDGDIKRALIAFTAVPPSLIISHSCPAGIGIGISGSMSLIEEADRFISRSGHYAGPFHDCGEGGLTRLWHSLAQRPGHWVFGHFHQIVEKVVEGTTFVCVGSTDDSDGVVGVRPVLYDTITRELLINLNQRIEGGNNCL